MLNRRILRIKAFKTLYSYALDPTLTLAEAESQLERSCESTRSLYLFMLSVIPALTAEARTRIEEASRKFHPTEEERNPNLKFVRNALAPVLEDDPDFQKALSRVKLSWEQYDAFLRALYESVRSKEYFAEYMADPDASLGRDVRLFIRIFEEEFVDSARNDGKFTGKFSYENKKGNEFVNILLNLAPLLLFIFIWIFIMRRMGGGAGGSGGVFSVGKSKAKMYEKGNDLGVTLDVGLHGVEIDLAEQLEECFLIFGQLILGVLLFLLIGRRFRGLVQLCAFVPFGVDADLGLLGGGHLIGHRLDHRGREERRGQPPMPHGFHGRCDEPGTIVSDDGNI